MKNWERYEDAVREVLARIADEIGLESVVKEKKEYDGDATSWELDVTAFEKGTGDLVVFECKKRGRNVEKGEMGKFAFTLIDLGAKGFLVSEKRLSKGAQEIADHKGIGHMQFKCNLETGDSVLRWLNTVYSNLS